MNIFNEKFRSLVTESGIKQKQLAEELQISEAALVNYKKDRLPKSEELFRIARYFNISMESLLCDDPLAVIDSARQAADAFTGTQSQRQAVFEQTVAYGQKLQKLRTRILMVNKKIAESLSELECIEKEMKGLK